MSQADLLDGIDAQDARTDTRAARRAMIDSQLRPNDVNDKVLLAAVERIAREDYLPADRRAVAYRDRAIPLGDGRFAPAPTVLFKLIDRAQVREGERAMVVGPNADYAAAVLADLGLTVIALDTVASTGPAHDRVETSKGALERGYGADDSFDLILVTGAIEQVSDALIAQLKADGRIAAPVIEGGVSRLAIGRKVGEQISFRSFADAQVARLAAFDAPQRFTF
ncbi:protein-L-isoaspartate O-methyltransferase [Sphingomicrobium sp. XHP0239]|uniref:protein-L-isoaspartate O-methyltransferase family protein n=1 Tax=Sphingomicrobium maritimum TaxID=3133972 RepID=UPI0031CC931B